MANYNTNMSFQEHKAWHPIPFNGYILQTWGRHVVVLSFNAERLWTPSRL